MKKMFLALMALVTMSTGLFAKELYLNKGDFFISTDDTNVEMDFSSLTDKDTVEKFVECYTIDLFLLNGDVLYYTGCSFETVDPIAEKYQCYFEYSKKCDKSKTLCLNIGDGRMVKIYFIVGD